MEDKIKVNIEIMDIVKDYNLQKLIDGLKKIEGFDFFVDAQFHTT